MYNLWCFVAFYNILLQNQFFLRFTLFCREISFGMIYALLRGENCACGEKITNMRLPSFHQMVLNSKWQVQEGRKGIGMSVLTKIAPRPNDGQKTYIQDKSDQRR